MYKAAVQLGKLVGEKYADEVRQYVMNHAPEAIRNNEAIMNMITTLVGVGILLLIAVIIMYNVTTAAPTIPDTSPFCSTMDSVENTSNSALALVVIVMIVLAAAGVMFAVRLLRAGGE